MKQTKKRSPARIPLGFYLAALLIWAALCTAALVQDSIARSAGDMPETVLSAENRDFYQMDVLRAGEAGKLACLSADPQMRWSNDSGIRVRSVTMTASYSRNPIEISLYYLTGDQTEYIRAQRIYAQDNGDGSYTFVLPRTDVTALRFDICSTPCVVRNFSVTLNPLRPAWQYYVPTYWQMFQMLLYPGLAASLASLLWGASLHAKRWLDRRRGGPAPDKPEKDAE